MNNGLGWNRLPKSFMGENTVFLLLTALIRNFCRFIMERFDMTKFGLKVTSRIKAFVFKFISVPPNGSGHQGSMCWISIHAATLMLMCSRMTLDNTDNLWSWFCVLPQVAWWGKGNLCVFVAIFAALRPLLPQCRYLFDLCAILWGRLRIWGIYNAFALTARMDNVYLHPGCRCALPWAMFFCAYSACWSMFFCEQVVRVNQEQFHFGYNKLDTLAN